MSALSEGKHAQYKFYRRVANVFYGCSALFVYGSGEAGEMIG